MFDKEVQVWRYGCQGGKLVPQACAFNLRVRGNRINMVMGLLICLNDLTDFVEGTRDEAARFTACLKWSW